MKKSKVNIEYQRFDEVEKLSEPDIIKEKLVRSDTAEEVTEPAELVSRADYPIAVTYGQDVIRLSPRQRCTVADASKIKKPLPEKVVLIYKK